MRALDEPLPRERPGLLAGTPVPALVLLASTWLMAYATLSEQIARAVGLAVAHGALLGTALAWTSPGGSRDRWAPIEAAVVLGAAAAGSHVHPLGTLAYLAVPVWLTARRSVWLGAAAWRSGPAVAGGAVFGLLLGAHLLVNASLTLGYQIRTAPLLELAGWWTYDLGANVLAAEVFFRGALFDRAYRRWSFAPAAGLATSLAVARYLVDPLLPRSLAMAGGAAFYLTLLSAGNCWLVARNGTLGPPLAAAMLFFGAYRLLAPR
jgi:hypothetical protein